MAKEIINLKRNLDFLLQYSTFHMCSF